MGIFYANKYPLLYIAIYNNKLLDFDTRKVELKLAIPISIMMERYADDAEADPYFRF